MILYSIYTFYLINAGIDKVRIIMDYIRWTIARSLTNQNCTNLQCIYLQNESCEFLQWTQKLIDRSPHYFQSTTHPWELFILLLTPWLEYQSRRIPQHRVSAGAKLSLCELVHCYALSRSTLVADRKLQQPIKQKIDFKMQAYWLSQQTCD